MPSVDEPVMVAPWSRVISMAAMLGTARGGRFSNPDRFTLALEAGAVGQPAGQEVGRCRARELAEVAVEVRLVVVAAVVGDLGPALGLAAVQEHDDAVEAQ